MSGRRRARSGARGPVGPTKAAAIGRRLDARVREMKEGLARLLLERRARLRLTQAGLARRLKTSQARISRIEAADRTVSLELLVRALLATGARRREIARAIGSDKRD